MHYSKAIGPSILKRGKTVAVMLFKILYKNICNDDKIVLLLFLDSCSNIKNAQKNRFDNGVLIIWEYISAQSGVDNASGVMVTRLLVLRNWGSQGWIFIPYILIRNKYFCITILLYTIFRVIKSNHLIETSWRQYCEDLHFDFDRWLLS